jgi:glycosyltransferase involved in cell wall biosynthesis
VRLGLIVRCDNGGLGILSREHVKYLNPDKVMVVKIGIYPQFPERYPGAMISVGSPTDEQVKEFLKDLDVCLTFETPYNNNLYRIAREMRVKTINQINYEWLEFFDRPDMFQVPSEWHMNAVPGPSVFLRCPVSRGAVPFRLRKCADTFLHVGGHRDTSYGRNGTQELLDAIPLVKSDVKFIVTSQSSPDEFRIPEDSRLDMRFGEFEDYGSLYDEGDIFVYPRRYGGQSLPLNEALSAGLPVLMPDMEPQDGFLPEAWLMPASTRREIEVRQPFDMCTVSHEVIAKMIDFYAHKDITKDSWEADRLADSMSWEALLPEYRKMFDMVIMDDSFQVVCE